MQYGLWLIVLHKAFSPQVPGHGSRHFWFEHALFGLQSESIEHSGRQVGGDPMYPLRQEHIE